MTSQPLPGNPHATIASARLQETPAPPAITAEQVHFMADALTQATLANAYELRTANLLQLEVLMAGGTGRGRRGSLERIGERMEEQEPQEERPTVLDHNYAIVRLEILRGQVDQLAHREGMDANTLAAVVALIEREQAR